MESWISIPGGSFYSLVFCEAREVKNVTTLLPHFHDICNSYKDKIPWLLSVCEPQFPGFGVSTAGSLSS